MSTSARHAARHAAPGEQDSASPSAAQAYTASTPALPLPSHAAQPYAAQPYAQQPFAGQPHPAQSYPYGAVVPGYPAPPTSGFEVLYPRVEPPSGWPVAIFTLIFGAFGAISASRRASKARLLGVSGQRYWWTFAGVLIMSSLLQLIMVGIALPVYLAAVHDAQAKAGGTTSETTSLSTAATPTRDARALEADIVAHGRSEASGTATGATGGVTAAACSAVNVVPDGSGTYRCLVSFSDSAEQTYTIKLAPDGTWTTGEGP